MYSTRDVTDLTGLSVRQVNYLVRTDVLEVSTTAPDGVSKRSGYDYRYTEQEVMVAAVMKDCCALHVPREFMRQIARQLRRTPPTLWARSILITRTGVLVTMDHGAPVGWTGWLLDLGAVRDRLSSTL